MIFPKFFPMNETFLVAEGNTIMAFVRFPFRPLVLLKNPVKGPKKLKWNKVTKKKKDSRVN